MKYPILHYTWVGQPSDSDPCQVIYDSDGNDIEVSPVEKAIVLFKGKEYAITHDEDGHVLIEPPNESIKALFMSPDFHELTPEYSDEQVYRALQEALQVFEKDGRSIFVDSKYWDEPATADKAG